MTIHRSRRAKGFTLMEMLLVLGIIALLVGMGTFMMVDVLGDAVVRGASLAAASNRVGIAMSGGVDSAMVLTGAVEEGHEAVGLNLPWSWRASFFSRLSRTCACFRSSTSAFRTYLRASSIWLC